MRQDVFILFDESNFDAYDRDRYGPVLEAGLAHHGLGVGDVHAVTQDFGVWAICTPGVFRARIKGIFNKSVEVGDLIPYSEIEEVRVEPSGPRSGKLVMLDVSNRQLGQIEFGVGGPDRTIEGERAQCERIVRIMETAWRQAG